MVAKYQFYKQIRRVNEVIPVQAIKWHPDPKGYFLIRVNQAKKRLEVGFVNYQHILKKELFGQNAEDIYATLIKRKLVSRLEHAAYLGKELYKAELALKYGFAYVQEFPLKLGLKVKTKLKKES